MVWAVRRLIDRIREEDEEERRRVAVRQQAALVRKWERLGSSPLSLNPLGTIYEQAREQDSSLRPDRFVRQQAEQERIATSLFNLQPPAIEPPVEPPPTGLEGLAQGFAPTGLEAQQFAFQGVTPTQAGGPLAQQFFEQVTPEQFPAIQRLAEAGLTSPELIEQARFAPPAMAPGAVDLGGIPVSPPMPPTPAQQALTEATNLLPIPAGREPIQVAQGPTGLASFAEVPSIALGALERVREIEEPAAEWMGEALLKTFGVPGTDLDLTRVPRAKGVAMEVTRPTNLVPIPFLDAKVARLAGMILPKLGRALPPLLRRLVVRAGRRIAQGTLPREERIALQQFRDQGEQTLSRMTEEVTGVPGGVAEPIEAVPRAEAGIRPVEVPPEMPMGAGPEQAAAEAPTRRLLTVGERIIDPSTKQRGTVRGTGMNEVNGEPLASVELDSGSLWRFNGLEGAHVRTLGFDESDLARLTLEERRGYRNAMVTSDVPAMERIEAQIRAGKALTEGAPAPPQPAEAIPPQAAPAEAVPAAPGRAAIPEEQARPLVGEEPEWALPPARGGAELPPTARQVESASKAVPAEVRAERAAPPPDVRVPMEDWATVESRIGTRYQKNWWTKIDDVIGKVRGRDRQLERDVRNMMIVRDEYIRSQGGRMRVGVLDWIGRNRKVLGLKTQGGRRGYAEALQSRPGVKIPKGLEQHLDHITEHPEKYIISDEQARALQERQDIFENVLRSEQRHGVNVEELSGAYAPRVIVKTPKGVDHQVALTNVTQRFFKTRPWYTKARAIPDIEGLWSAGYRTLDSLSAMELRVTGGAETIANVQSLRRVRGMGYKPMEKLQPELLEELSIARTEYQAIRKQALKKGSTTDHAALVEAEVRLDQAKRDVRAAGRLLVEKQPKVLGRVVPPEVARELNRYLETVPEGAVDDFLRLARASLVTTDYGSPLLQNWFTFWRDTPTWLKSFAHGASAVPDAPYAFVVDHLDAIERGIRYGAIRSPEEFLLMRGGKLSQQVGKLPVIKESQRAFEWNIFTAQTYRWEAVEGTAKNADELFELASVLRKQSGANFMPGLTVKQARWLSRTWFAPQFTAALQTALVDPLVKSGPARREALKTLALAFGGAAVVTVGVNQKLNGELPNMTDPDKPGFWAIRIPDAAGGGYVYPFGPFQPTIVALARSGRAATAIANGEKPSLRDLQAWPRFASNKASIGVRLIMRAGEAMGLPIESLRGPSFNEPEVIRENENILQALQRELGGYAPIGAAQAYAGISEGAPITALEVGGGRTSVETPSQELRRTFREMALAGEFGPEYQRSPDYDTSRGDRAIAEDNDRLAPLLRRADERSAGRGFEGAVEREQRQEFLVERERELRLPEKAASVLRGNIPAVKGFDEAYDEFRSTAADAAARDFFGTEFREARTPEGQRYNEYREISPWEQRFESPETLEIDWGLYMEAKDAARERLPPELQQAIENRTNVQDEGAIRLARALRGWRDELDPYYEQEEGRRREAFRRSNPQIDAILWITGSTTGVLSQRAQTLAADMLSEGLGIRIQPADVARRARTGGGRVRPGRPVAPRMGR